MAKTRKVRPRQKPDAQSPSPADRPSGVRNQKPAATGIVAINKHLGFEPDAAALRKIVDASGYKGKPDLDKLAGIVLSKPASHWQNVLGMKGDAAPATDKPKLTAEEKREKILAESRERNARRQEEKPAQPRRRRSKAEAVTTEDETPPNNLDEGVVSGGTNDLGSLTSKDLYDLASKKQIEEGMSFGDRAGYAGGRQYESVDGVDPATFEGVKPFEEAVAVTPASPQTADQSQATVATQQPARQQAAPEPKPDPFFKRPINPFGTYETPKLDSSRKPVIGDDGNPVMETRDRWARAALRNYTLPALAYGGGALLAGMGFGAMRGGQQQKPQDLNALMQQAVEAERRLQQRFGSHGEDTPIQIPADTPSKPEDTIRKSQGKR